MPTQKETNPFKYSDSNKRYYSYDYYLRQKFGTKIAKLPVDGGFTCPNRDGTKGFGGCIYCSARGSGDFCAGRELTVTEQMKRTRDLMSQKWKNAKYIAYFQAFTNTYAPVEELKAKYEEALAFPDTVGLSIATRADCLEDETVEYLARLAEETFVTIELGLQTVHGETAKLINRGHTFEDFLNGYGKLRKASEKINICIHLINGLPHETPEMMLESARQVAKLKPEQLKLHLLHVIKGTRLCEMYERSEFECMTLEGYADTVVRQLEIMPPETVIGRITGDGMGDTLIAPLWSRKKLNVMNTVDKLFYERNTYQGKFYIPETITVQESDSIE